MLYSLVLKNFPHWDTSFDYCVQPGQRNLLRILVQKLVLLGLLSEDSPPVQLWNSDPHQQGGVKRKNQLIWIGER